MRATWNRQAVAVALCLAGGAASAQYLVPEPMGPATKLHEVTGWQSGWAVNGMTPEGRRAVAYAAGSGADFALLGQMDYAPWWNPSASWPNPFVATDADDFGYPALDVSRYGSVLLAWGARDAFGNATGIVGRQFDVNGAPTSEVFDISSTQSGNFTWTRVASNESGSRHLVAWTTWSNQGEDPVIRGQLLDNYLEPVGQELQFNHTYASAHVSVDVAMTDEQGSRSAFVAWIASPEAATAPALSQSLFLRHVEEDGRLGPAVLVAPQVSGTSGELHDQPSLAVLPSGDVMVVWLRKTYRPESPRYSHAIYGQILNADLETIGSAFPIVDDGYSDTQRTYPKLTADGQLGFAVSWSERENPSAPMAVKLRRFRFGGEVSEIAEVSSPADGSHHLPSLASDADGDLSVVWTATAPNGENHVMERRYRGHAVVDLVTTANVAASQVHQGESTRFFVGVSNPNFNSLVEGYDAVSGLTVTIGHTSDTLLSPSETFWTCNGAAPTVCRYDTVLMAGAEADPLEFDVMAPAESGEVLIEVTASGDQAEQKADDNTATITLSVNDLMPETLEFDVAQGVARNALVESEPLTIDGIDADVRVAVWNGEYSLNGGAFTAVEGTAQNGDSIRLRHVAAATFDTTRTTQLAVGRLIAEFVTTTESADTSPDAFAFAPVSDVARGSEQVSNPVLISGINTAATVSISGGDYSVNGGAFTAAAGTVQAGDSLRLRHTASASFASPVTTDVVVGDASASFISTTIAADVVPDAYSFASLSNVARGSVVTSAAATISGIDVPVSITVSDGEYSVNGAAFTSEAGTVRAGDSLRLRHIASSTFSTPVTTNVAVGDVAASFTSTTEAADASPSAFSFDDVTDARRNRAVESNVITVSGINVATPISVLGGGAYSVNGGAYRTSSSTVQAGDTVQLRVTAPKAQYATVHTTLTMGDRSDVWSVTSGRR